MARRKSESFATVICMSLFVFAQPKSSRNPENPFRNVFNHISDIKEYKNFFISKNIKPIASREKTKPKIYVDNFVKLESEFAKFLIVKGFVQEIDNPTSIDLNFFFVDNKQSY